LLQETNLGAIFFIKNGPIKMQVRKVYKYKGIQYAKTENASRPTNM